MFAQRAAPLRGPVNADMPPKRLSELALATLVGVALIAVAVAAR